MAVLNESLYQNLTQIPELITIADSFTLGVLGTGIWLIVTFGALFLTSQFATRESLVASAFVSMIIAFFLRYLGLLPEFLLWLSGFLFVLSIIAAWFIDSPNSFGA